MPTSERDLLQKIKHISYHQCTHCAVCQNRLGPPLIRLSQLPLTEIFFPQPVHEPMGSQDQNFHFCSNCGHGQLSHILDPHMLYGNTYSFRTSLSRTARQAAVVFLDFIQETIGRRTFDQIIELGCNDLFMLKALAGRGRSCLGIDPVLAHVPRKGLPPHWELLADFVENISLESKLKGTKHLIIGSHVLEHVANPLTLMKHWIYHALDKTLFIFQFPDLQMLVEDGHFDQIFHQHLHYFTLSSFRFLLEEAGGELVSYRRNPHHWGALMVTFRKRCKISRARCAKKISNGFVTSQSIGNQYRAFQEGMHLVGKKMETLNGQRIYGYGAAALVPILNYHLKGGLSRLQCILDDDRKKVGWFYLNLPVPISWSHRFKDLSEVVLFITAVTAVMNIRSILGKMVSRNPRQIIVPYNIF